MALTWSQEPKLPLGTKPIWPSDGPKAIAEVSQQMLLLSQNFTLDFAAVFAFVILPVLMATELTVPETRLG